jgi:hypothetical protein
LDSIADPDLGTSGTALVELELSTPHPNFYGIVRIDERGIWYSDGDGSPQEAAWRLRLIPWGSCRGDHSSPGELIPTRKTEARGGGRGHLTNSRIVASFKISAPSAPIYHSES